MTIPARFIKRWRVKVYDDGLTIHDARDVYIVGLNFREDLHNAGWTLADKYLSRQEAVDLAEAITKLE